MDIESKLSQLVDDRDFQGLNARTGTFNLFEALGTVRGELHHSNFLAYLLSPSRSHGLGAEPLLAILRAILSSMEQEQRPVRLLELVVGDLDGSIVHRERDNIDLLIEIDALRLIVVIENKIGASASDGQLARYKHVARSRYPNHRHLFVFLTPEGIDPEDADYAAFDYSTIAKVIASFASDRHETLSPETKLILRHYVEMLRRHVVPDEEMEMLARRLYEKHKAAFDFVFDCRPEPDNLTDIGKSLVDQAPELIADIHNKTIARFVPASWEKIDDFNACPKAAWTHTGRNVLFEIKTTGPDRVLIALILGPAEADLRTRLYNAALSQPALFQGLTKPIGKIWTTIFSRELLSPVASRDMEFDQKAETITQRWKEFVAQDLPRLEKAMAAMAK